MGVNKVYCGHAISVLKILPDESVDAVFTSPPYYFARDYNVEPIVWSGDANCQHEWVNELVNIDNLRYRGKGASVGNNANKDIFTTPLQNQQWCNGCGGWRGDLGHEPHPDMYIDHLMMVFTECMRVLKKSGSLWINIDDSHASNGRDVFDTEKYNGKNGIYCGRARNIAGVKAKSLIGIPARLELAMIDAGWIVRNVLVWKKDNACPESMNDRFTIDYESIFFVVKNNKTLYWKNHKTLGMVDKQPLGIKGIEGDDWDWAGCRQCLGKGCPKCNNLGKKKKSNWEGRDYYFNQQFEPQKQTSIDGYKWGFNGNKTIGIHGGMDLAKQRFYADKMNNEPDPTRNMRAVWTISTKPLHEMHFAPFPLDLVERVINVSVPEQICDKCGLPRERVYNSAERINTKPGNDVCNEKSGTGDDPNIELHKSDLSKYRQQIFYKETGYTDCGCENPTYHAGIILDPFGGSGTVGVQAKAMNRDYLLIDSNRSYCDMAERRIADTVSQPALF